MQWHPERTSRWKQELLSSFCSWSHRYQGDHSKKTSLSIVCYKSCWVLGLVSLSYMATYWAHSHHEAPHETWDEWNEYIMALRCLCALRNKRPCFDPWNLIYFQHLLQVYPLLPFKSLGFFSVIQTMLYPRLPHPSGWSFHWPSTYHFTIYLLATTKGHIENGKIWNSIWFPLRLIWLTCDLSGVHQGFLVLVTA